MLQLQALEGQEELLGHQMQEIETQKRDINEQLMELKQSKLVEIPLIKHALSLYANITNLRWHYDSDASVKGYVTKIDDVRQFDVKERDPVKLADTLWGLM